MEQTITHSRLFPEAVRAMTPEVFGMDVNEFAQHVAKNYSSLTDIGIGGLDEIMRGPLLRSAMDSATIQGGLTQPSIPVALQFLQQFLPGFIKIITAARKADEIMGINTAGSWEDEQVVQGIIENTGTAVPYGDTTNVPLASWNENWVERTVVRFELGIRVNKLEEMRAAKIKVNSAQEKRESAALMLEQQRNAVAFYGYNNGNNNTYGFLNDPQLPNYRTVAASGTAGSTLWSQKNFQQIIADIRTAMAQLQTQSQDNINPEDVPTTLALATAVYQYLSVTTDFGISVREWLRTTYPKCRVVSAPQLNAANSSQNVFYLFADSVQDSSTDDGRTFSQLIQAKFQVLGVMQLTKGYEEDYSNATAGSLCKRPYAVTRWSGV